MAEFFTEDHTQKHRHAAIRLAELAGEISIPSIVAKPNPNDPYKYEKASELLFGMYTASFPEERFRSGGVILGFNVSFRLAAWGLRAYRSHIADTEGEAKPKELGEILGRSYDSAVTTFSSVANNKNRLLERAFGLNQLMSPAYEPLPFTIETSSRGKMFTPSELTLTAAMLDPEYEIEDEILTVGRCPASGKMLRKVWAATIDTCVNSGALFPYDLDAA